MSKGFVLQRIIILWGMVCCAMLSTAQTISIVDNQTATVLANHILGKGITLAPGSMTLSCNNLSNGIFVNNNPFPTQSLAIDSGIVFSTGRVLTVAGDTGINFDVNARASKNMGITTTDPQITTIAGSSAVQRDLCYLQFNFTPKGDSAFIDYSFASEDYPDFVCLPYVDAIGIFVAPPSASFVNYAKVPGTSINVSVNSINDTTKPTGASNYATYCVALGSGSPFIQYYTKNLITNHIVYNGFTKVLKARIPVQPNLLHTMKIAIADITDAFFDSGLFLKKSSFNSPPLLEITDKKGTNPNRKDSLFLIEGCNAGAVQFNRSSISSPITVNVSYSGTAISSDYTGVSSFTIPAGNNSYTYDLSAVLDGLKESTETLRVIFSSPAINFYDTTFFYIKDFANGINIFNGKKDTSLCVGQSVNLSYTRTDTTFSAVWTPATNISCTNCFNTTYTWTTPNVASTQFVYLRISAIGCPTADSPLTIYIQPKPILSLNSSYSICKGDSVQLNASVSPAGTYTYLWTPNVQLSSSTILNPWAKPLTTQTYKLLTTTTSGCKDSINTTVSVSNIRIEIDSMRVTNTTCGTNNGSIRLYTKTSAPNNPPYQYSINGGSTFGSGNVFTSLTAGNYNVAIKNNLGCRFDTVLIVTSGTNAPSATYSVTNTSCGLNNGSAKILTKSGIAPLSIAWKLGATTISTDTFINARPAGTYTLSITDSAGCIVQYTFVIQPSSAPNFAFIKTDQTCGLSNGSILANPTGGAAPFSYNWSNGGTSSSITGLTAGLYKLTFTDNNGCIKIDSTTLVAYPPITKNKNGTNATCGASNGTAQAIVSSGGTPPFIYTWSTGATTGNTTATFHTITGLTGGKYKFTIQDSKGCIAIDSVIITASPALVVSVNRTNATCGVDNGAINLSILSGTPSYTFAWNDGATTQNRMGLAVGSYNVTVTDAIGCTATNGAVVSMLSSPVLTTTKFNTTCGLNNGRITTNVSGAAPPITYAWSNGSTNTFIDNLAVGVYTLTITDSFGCQKIKSDTITSSVYTNFTDSVVHTKCNLSNGQIYLKNVVGAPTISILWSDGNTSATRTGLSPGNYSVLVQDGNGCTKSKTFTINTSNNPIPNLTITNALCLNTTGAISCTVSGGTPAYTYNWSSGETTANITSKIAGTYSVTVTDINSCTGTSSGTILRRPSPTYQDSFRKARCGFDNGLIRLYNIVGSKPFGFQWSNDANLKDSFAFGLPSQIIEVTITDSNGCVVRDTFDLRTNGAIAITSSMVRSKCSDSTGKLIVTIVNGTSPYTIQWSNGDTGLIADTLKHGKYQVQITDSLGCIYRDTLLLKDSTNLRDSFQISKTRCDTASGNILAFGYGGTSPYKHVWQRLPRDTFALLDSVNIGTYNVTTTDSLGCKFDTFAIMRYTHYPTIKDSIILEKCAGGNGEVHIRIDSVVNPIQIYWNSVLDSTYKKLGLKGPKSYLIYVVDADSCTVALSTQLDISPITPPYLSSAMPPCGNNTGSITATLPSPSLATSYTWSNGGSGSTITGLSPGIYNVTITDTSGCNFVLSDTLAYTAAPTINYSTIRPNCGRFDGSIRVVVSTTYGGYNYSYKKWGGGFSTPQSAADTVWINNLDSGTYVVQIADAVGCIKYDTLKLMDSAAPQLQIKIKNSHCTNGNGKAKLIVSGGATPYSFMWYNFSTIDSQVNLFSGNYMVTVTDMRNCSVIDTAKVLYVPGPSTSLLAVPSYCSPNNGKIFNTISLGQAPFTYNWSNGATTKDLLGLVAGTYRVTVTDSAGCIKTDSAVIVSQPPLQVSLSKTPAYCDLNNGTASATVITGKPPYIFNWNATISSMTISSLDTGKQIFYISDSNNCEWRDSIQIVRVQKHSASHNVVNDNCTYKIGSISTSVSAGKPPYTYAWSNGLGTSANANNVGAGTYTLSVTDSLGCVATSIASVGDTAGPVVSLIVTDATCGNSNGSILGNVISSRTPLSYFWNNIASASNVKSGINGGKFVFKVIDNRGCIKQDSVTLDTVKPLSVSLSSKNLTCNLNNGYIKVNATGGTGTKSYTWSHTATNTDSVFGLSAGKYKVTVSDTKGCLWIDSVTLVQLGFPNIAFNKTNATCRNANGSISTTVTNASGAITYAWSTGNTTSSIINVPPNNYTLTVTDAANCSTSSTTTLLSNGVDSVPLLVNHPKCNLNNGKIKAQTFNTFGTVNFVWSNGGGNKDSIINLGAGAYSVTVTDNLCTMIRSANLVMATSPIVSATKLDPSCGINNGEVTATVAINTGTMPFSYTWNGTPSPPIQTNLDIGTYKVVVTDINSCKDSATVTLTRIPALNASFAIQKSKCGDANGSIATTIIGGAPQFHYLWSNGDTTKDLNNIYAGNYTVTISDDQRCTITRTMLVEDRKKPQIFLNKINSVCNKPNGSISSTVVDGNPPFTYLWNTGETTTSISNIIQGVFTLIVTDSLGCKDTAIDNIISGPPPPFDSIAINRSTCNLSNGSIYTRMSTRAINPVYTWSTGFVGNFIQNIGPGSYTITVTDDRQCEIIQSFVVPTTTNPIISLTQSQSFCLKKNGKVFSSVTLGTGSYNYQWSTGKTSSFIDSLYPGIYTLTVSDSLNCRDTASISVTEEENKVKATYDTFNLICYNDFSGRVKFYPSGGQAPYTFKITTPTTDSVLSGLGAGKHYFTVEDSRGCLYNDSFSLIEPPKMITSIVYKKDLICYNQPDGEIMVKTQGGTYPYTYTWQPSGVYGDRALNLLAGEHTVAVRDLIGCKDTFKTTLIQPKPITILGSIQDNLCYGQQKGSITLAISDGTQPYSYVWSNGARTKDLNNLLQGVYLLQLTDSNGCKASYKGSLIDPPRQEKGRVDVKHQTCDDSYNGSLTVYGQGGIEPYQFSLDTGKKFVLNNKFTALKPKEYYIVIRDKELCQTYVRTVINDVPAFDVKAYPSYSEIELGASVNLGYNVTQGDKNWINKILWREKDGLSCVDCDQPTATPFINTKYVLEVNYLNSCTVYDTVTIVVNDNNELYIPSAFSPNAEKLENREFRIYSNKIVASSMSIFNRWGEKMYEGTEPHLRGWNGVFKGELAPAEIYTYVVEVTYLSGRKVQRRGTFTLVR